MARFSKLKKQIENLFDPTIKMQFCCSAYPMRSKVGYAHNSIPRFYLKMNDKILWDYPKDFAIKDEAYGYWAGNNGISELIREYIDTPVSQLLGKEFTIGKQDNDSLVASSLTDLLKVADRRISKDKIAEYSARLTNYKGYAVVCARLYGLDSLAEGFFEKK